ncbi:hypothetical protein BT69DRAFT_1316797 [Atractiella rhizophila]|nr:hypothetical protein BT69DRAFT_1316797 [Atractiella rhizophila]
MTISSNATRATTLLAAARHQARRRAAATNARWTSTKAGEGATPGPLSDRLAGWVEQTLAESKSRPLFTYKGHLYPNLALALSKSLPPPFADTRPLAQSPFYNLSLRDESTALPPLWELIYLNESEVQCTEDVKADGSDSMVTEPPSPGSEWERMWVGGSFEYPSATKGLMVNKFTRVEIGLEKVEFKTGKDGREGIYVTQRRSLKQIEREEEDTEAIWDMKAPLSIDRRTHLYRLPLEGTPSSSASSQKSAIQPSSSTSRKPHSHFKCVANSMHLFRFSALTFNGHRIHWDERYSQEVERREGPLVHGPLTCLLLASSIISSHPEKRLKSWKYRATSPLVVGRPFSLNGRDTGDGFIEGWAEHENGGEIMSGVAKFH